MRSQLALLGGRLLATTLLLGGSVVLARIRGFGEEATDALAFLIAATYASALAVGLLLNRVRRPELLAWAQIIWDLGIITGLVYFLGGAGSGFSFLYGVVILASALVLGTRATQITTGIALTLYLGVGLGVINEWLPAPWGDAENLVMQTEEVAVAMVRTFIGLILVSLLAGQLAARLSRAGGRLAGVERLNRDIVRSLSSGLLTTNLDGVITRINPGALSMLGATAEDVVGRPLLDFLHVELDDIQAQPIQRGEGEGTRVGDDDTFPLGFTRSPLRDDEDQIVGGLVVFQDLTEIRALRRTAAQAEKLAALGRLSASLAHEIRNPLSSISGSVEIIADSPALADDERRLLTLVLGEVDRLNELVSTMLDVGRPRTPDPLRLDLGALAEDVARVARGSSSFRGALVVILPESPVMVRADPGQLRQLLWNLVKNAAQFSGEGDAIDVEVGRDEVGAPTLSVRDRGPGIANDELKNLFEVFYSTRHHGVGLGLALVRQIVDAHDAEIAVDSTLGEGTVFSVTFVAPEEAPAIDAAQSEEDDASEPDTSLDASVDTAALERAGSASARTTAS